MREVQNADALFIFYPLEGEVNLLPLADYAKESGKSVAFPVCEDKNGNMRFCEVSSLDNLETGSFGIKEPQACSEEKLPKSAVIFLPALSIDSKGYRLGYGKGYYDRYLAKYADLNPFLVGVIYSELVSEKLPRDEHDIACDAVVSEDGAFYPFG